ncbi:glycosyltransferase family 4 protein [Nakamurella endophytica]|uniref:Glycosyl transferase n=1 Tax=Nakamurella endophytica TaxID=1748367 RepID=A0A917SW28_9ACTN|nr:glycosyltransferase family 1 protein [Nakamurella endophytica]GGM01488.1 glycosyl transferase [Nakamurella endophytica]
MPELVVVVEQCLAPVPGGTGRYAAQIAAALVRTAPAGWRVRSVAAWHRDVTAARVPGVRGPRRLPVGRRALTLLWERGLPPWPLGASVHATTPLFPRRLVLPARPARASATDGSGRRRRPGRPVVVTVHDTVPWTHPETLTPRGVAWHRAVVARAVREADAVVVPSRTVGDELTALFPELGGRLAVVPHGVTELAVPDDAERRRVALGLPPGYLLSLATLEPRKGLDVLLGALGRPECAGMVLAVAGRPGWGGLDPVELARRAGVSPDRLRLLGGLPDADLAAVLAGAAALVAPSRAEGFGLPVLEAFAAGVPVVHSDAPALVEVAGGAAVVVPRGDERALAAALHRVTADRDFAATLSERGRRRAGDFDWGRSAEATWDLHLRVRDRRGRD